MKIGKVAFVRLGSRVLIPAGEVSRLAALARPFGFDAPVADPVVAETSITGRA
ncbi:MAG TPA: hypothetical protein PLV73_11170 [Treponemataceae bacterium]|nr:hypothetical protein [Treponemataceae bacterium]